MRGLSKIGLGGGAHKGKHLIIPISIFTIAFIGAFFIGRQLLTPSTATDLNLTDNSTGGYDISVNVGQYIQVPPPEPVVISMSLSNLEDNQTLILPIIAMPGGSVTIRSMQVATSTTNRYGYTLMIEGTTALTGEQSSSNTIDPVSGTIMAPSQLSTNTWGFAIARRMGGYVPNTFNLSYQTETNRPLHTSSTRFAAVPAAPTPIRRVQRTTVDDTLSIYFGVSVDDSIASDIYSGTVIYTAVPNAPSDVPRTLIGVTDMDPTMIPVIYDSSGNAIKADYMKDNWYDYGYWWDDIQNQPSSEPFGTGATAQGNSALAGKMWANTVTIRADAWQDVQDNIMVGEIIPSSTIIGQWVYIPRYRYDVMRQHPLNAAVSPQLFAIRWQKKEDPKYYPTAYVPNPVTDGQPYQTLVPNQDERWFTHPAFTLGTCTGLGDDGVDPDLCRMDVDENYYVELDGVWIGKTKMTGTAANPTVVVSQIPLQSTSVGDFWVATRGPLKTQHGFATGSDLRGARNADWGAVAYLSMSAYGKGSEITAGNCGASNIATVAASSTNNMYGVYGMAGYCYDYVMANFGTNGTVGSSGFFNTGSVFPNSLGTTSGNLNPATGGRRYLDLGYNTLATCTFATCGGHALFETAGWYSDEQTFVSAGAAWFMRGSVTAGATAGGFAFNASAGNAGYGNIGWRPVQSKF